MATQPLYAVGSYADQIRKKNLEAKAPLMTAAEMVKGTPIIPGTVLSGPANQGNVNTIDHSGPTTGSINRDSMGREPGTPGYNSKTPLLSADPRDNASIVSSGGSTFSPATVATKSTPVVDRSPVTNKTYTPQDFSHLETLDLNGLQDAADYYAVQQTKRALTDQEQLDLRKIGRLMQSQAAPQNPTSQYQSAIDAKQQEADAKQVQLQEQDNTTLGFYKKQQEIDYAQQIEEARKAGQREKDAAQSILSFSGFGRSSKAAEQQGSIQQKIESNISLLNAKKEAEIHAKELELAGATDKALEPIRKYIEGLNTAQIAGVSDFIKQTNEYNSKLAGTYQDKIDNILKASTASGMTYDKLNAEQKVMADTYSKLALNKDGDINESFMKEVSTNHPDLAFAVMQKAAEKAGAKQGDYQYIQGDKTNPAVVFDKDTGEFRVVPGGAAGGKSGNGSYSSLGGVKPSDVPLVNLLVQYKDFLKNTTAVGNLTSRDATATKNSLIGLITAEYKQAKKLGTLDAGVEKLINGVLGNGGISKLDNSSQVIAVDQFLSTLGSSQGNAFPSVNSSSIKEGSISKSKSGKDIIFRNGQREYK